AQGRGRADLRDGREPYLDGAAAGLSLRGDGTVRDADADGTHPPAADDGRRGGRGTLARSQREHVAGRAPGGGALHPREPGSPRLDPRSGPHRARARPVRSAPAADGGGLADPAVRSAASGTATGQGPCCRAASDRCDSWRRGGGCPGTVLNGGRRHSMPGLRTARISAGATVAPPSRTSRAPSAPFRTSLTRLYASTAVTCESSPAA